MSPTATQFQLSFGVHARLMQAEDGFRVSTREQEFRFRAPALGSTMARLADGATEDALCEEALQSGEASALYSLMGVLRALDAGGALQRRLVVEGRPFATLIPKVSRFRFEAEPPVSKGQRKLSRLAYIRSDRNTLVVESPLGFARLELHDGCAAAVVAALAQPRSIEELESIFPDLGMAPIEALLILLHNTAVLVDDGDGEGSTSWWEFHDLLFHMRSRRGRHDAPYGGTYRQKISAPTPLIKPRQPGRIVPLVRPDLEELRRTDPPFADVVERRRSVREYRQEPIAIEQLSEFLYRSARYQRVQLEEKPQHALRPTPAGGALHELELYPVVSECRGLERGVYHYRPYEHELTQIASPSPLFERLIEQAWITADRKSPLNILLQVTARCHRVFWKYESMAYALILKNLGALYTTMYLAATVMNLAPCALGGGDSELFAAIAGMDPYEEPAVGEFTLGSRASN